MSIYENRFMDYYNYLFRDLAGKINASVQLDLMSKIVKIFVADYRTNDWPLITSPVPGLTILGAYLYFVLSWGPKYMANRKPYKLERLLIVYNLLQVLVSVYIFVEVSAKLTTSTLSNIPSAEINDGQIFF